MKKEKVKYKLNNLKYRAKTHEQEIKLLENQVNAILSFLKVQFIEGAVRKY